MADTVKVGPWGAPDGQARDVNIDSRPQRLKTITIGKGSDSGNERITGISFDYVDQQDQQVHVGPWGNISTDRQKIELEQDEQLNCVSGTFNESAGITWLELTINEQRYDFGQRKGSDFSVPLPKKEGEEVAFFGRSDDSTLKALGVYVLGKNGLPIMIGPWGGTGGTFVDITPRPVELKGVTVYGTKRIHGFSFTYVDQHDNSISTPTWGTSSEEKQTFDLNQDEYVNIISGSFDNHNGVNSLQFHTNKNVYGPYGYLSGTVFSVPLPDKAMVGNKKNGAVVGFFGRSGGDGLVALGVYLGLAPNPKP